jgi:DNA-binding transcriptional regulator GbsR (MarR family)
MSQIHALLMVSAEPLNTDEIMAELGISRGNAHTNLRELVRWGLLHSIRHEGDRKEYFEAEKDVWQVVRIITRERKRKELQPALQTLESCLDQTRGLRDGESRAFRRQLGELQKFARLADRVMEKIGRERSGIILPWIMRFLR